MPDGSRLVASGDDGALHLLDLASERQLATVPDAGSRLVVSPDGRFIVAEGLGVEPALVLDPDTLQPVAAPAPGRPLAVGPNGRDLVIARVFGESGVSVYDTASWQEVLGLDIGAADAVFLPDGDRLLLASEPGQGTTRGEGLLWDLGGEVEVARLPLPGRGVPGGIAVSGDGALIAVGEGETGYIGVWRTDALSRGVRSDEALLGALAAPPDLNALAFSHDGSQLLAAGKHVLTVLDVDTGDRAYRIDFDAEIRGLALSPNGRYVALATDDGLHVITTDLDDLIDIAEDRIGRAFTSEECRSYLHVEECPTA
jgi:WD40 repeat protein